MPERTMPEMARTPPMGWMSWNAFGRELNEEAVLGNADALVRLGLRQAGYQYICLDDYWQGGRDANGRLHADPHRFPRGIPALADELHARGLMLGIYTCAGPLTCGGEAGSEGFEDLDAMTFAEWGVDYVKDDYCHAPADRGAAIERYRRMGDALARTDREIVFAVCEWGQRAPWEWARSVQAHVWRIGPDIQDAWSGAGGIIAVADQAEALAEWAAPGGWNDPDMLVVGLRGRSRAEAAGTAGCSDAEYRTQMSLWAMLAAPLFVSCDLRTADAETIAILTAPGVLAIDQDPLGRPGRRIRRTGTVDVWQRTLADDASAVALVNRGDGAVSVTVDWTRRHGGPADIVNAWTNEEVDAADAVALEPHATALFRTGLLDTAAGEIELVVR
jgi:alpha-galactosidase